MKLFRLGTGCAGALLMASLLLGAPGLDFGTWECLAASSPNQWQAPAGALAEQIAGVLGPGQATLIVRNLSSIADSDVPIIRTSLEQNLKAHGIATASGETANLIRITLSQNDRERLWVAEIIQGNETRVVMVPAGSVGTQTKTAADYMTLRRERLPILMVSRSGWLPEDPVLGAVENQYSLLILRSYGIEILAFGEGGWLPQKTISLDDRRPFSRDPRGVLIPSSDRDSFTAFIGSSECSGNYTPASAAAAHPVDNWTIHCHASDEPWPILQNNDPANRVTIKAFYNAARNYFTGVITPSLGVDLPPFYSAALVSRPNGPALIIAGIDGKVQVVDNGALKPVSGARDWGSDFAILKSGCGSGAQVIASGSGEAPGDSLRAYELPAQEAIPASAPLAMNGSVTALWTAPDGKSLLAAVRQPSGDYEVDRVTALCN
jgi:hypothetical protein